MQGCEDLRNNSTVNDREGAKGEKAEESE